MLVLGALICWNQWSGQPLAASGAYHSGSRIIATGYIALLYTFEALFFRYGEVRPESEKG